MKNHHNKTKDIIRKEFHLSESSPVVVLHHQSKQEETAAHYNMHFELELGILLEGGMRRFTQDKQQDIRPGDVWLCGMWEPHGSQITKNDTEAVVLIIYPPTLIGTHLDRANPIRLLGPFENEPENKPQPNLKNKSKIMELAMEIVKLSGKSSPLTNAKMKIKLFEILLILMESWKPSIEKTPQTANELAIINKAVTLVFTKPNGITTQQAAAACSMNRNSFAKLFSQVMGIKFSEFELRFRITKAANLLKNTTLPIKKIASDCAFANVPHLHMNFRKFYNQTPKEFRDSP